ncbi:transposase [Streptomyces sp. NPDC001919]
MFCGSWWGSLSGWCRTSGASCPGRVVPEAPSRPQGGGRRRHGDRDVLTAIAFVATSDCTWRQLPSASSGATAHRWFSD